MLYVFICQFWEVVQVTFFLEYFWETYFKYKLQDSTASRSILIPFERYGCPKNIFPCVFYVTPKWNIVYKYLKNKRFFKRLKYPSPNALNTRYFWTLSYNYWGFGGITKISNPELKENGMPKKRMDAALQEKSISQVLLKHFIQEQEVAIRRLEAATRGVL